jgi:hypothetical protein
MNVRWFAGVLVLVALGAGAWMLLRPPEFTSAPAVATTLPAEAPVQRAAASPSKLSASAGPSIDPRNASGKAQARAAKSLNAEFLTTKSLKALYDR